MGPSCPPAPNGELGFEEHDDEQYELKFGLARDLLPLYANEDERFTGDEKFTSEPKHDARPTAYLDGLRGLAALLVYISHHVVRCYGGDEGIRSGYDWAQIKKGTFASQITESSDDRQSEGRSQHITALPFIRVFFNGGGAAVAIFFVLSGYVLSRNLLIKLRAGDKRMLYRALGKAVIKRPFRLYAPPVAVSLGVALLMQLPTSTRPWLAWPESQPSLSAELWHWAEELVAALNPFIYHDVMTRWFPYDPPIWTMPVEMLGSLLVFALVGVLSLRPARYWKPMSAVAAVTLLLYGWAMPCFVAGQLLALDHLDATNEQARTKNRNLFGSSRGVLHHALAILGWYLLGVSHDGLGTNNSSSIEDVDTWSARISNIVLGTDSYRFWNTLGAIMLIYALLRISWLQRLLMRPSLQFLGRVSFALYLTHMPFLWMVGDRLYRMLGAVRDSDMHMGWDSRLSIPDIGPPGFSTRFVVAQVVIAPLTLALAYLATRWIDEPSVRLAQWIAAACLT
jgi:peptidoglycan/LPS O-acetylase OafA/YrhL